MKLRSPIFFIGCILVTAVFAQDPKKTAAQLTGDAKGSAANNPVCKLFTAAEASKYVGKTVGNGQNAAMGSGCQWAAKDYEGDMMVQIVAASYHVQPTMAKGFQAMPFIIDPVVENRLDAFPS